MSERKLPSSVDDIEVDSLESRLKAARDAALQAESGKRKQGLNPSDGMSAGFQVATELVVALLVAVAIGWFLDGWLESRPLFLIIFFFLGAAAGALNVYRRARLLVGDKNVDDGKNVR